MTAMNFAPMRDSSSSTPIPRCESPMKPKQSPSSSFFDDPSFAKQWSDVEATLAVVSAHYRDDSEAEIGWIEGRVHETRSTQKEVEILLAQTLESRDAYDGRRDEALRIYITCPQFALFVFAINQHIKISLRGARLVHELVSHGSPLSPFSLVFGSSMAVQSVRGGVCMPDGTVVDTRLSQERYGECHCLGFATSKSSLGGRPITPAPKTPPRYTQSTLYPTSNEQGQAYSPSPTMVNSAVADIIDEIDACPPLTTLTEGMATPILGIVESTRPPTTTSSGDLCVGLTLADASSYSSGRGFKLTCFTSRSRLGRDLPTPAEGDAILLKFVKISKWLGGIIGTVYPNKLDWIVYNPETGAVVVPRHAKSEPMDPFYEDLERRKIQFKTFIDDVGLAPGRTNHAESSQAAK